MTFDALPNERADYFAEPARQAVCGYPTRRMRGATGSTPATTHQCTFFGGACRHRYPSTEATRSVSCGRGRRGSSPWVTCRPPGYFVLVISKPGARGCVQRVARRSVGAWERGDTCASRGGASPELHPGVPRLPWSAGEQLAGRSRVTATTRTRGRPSSLPRFRAPMPLSFAARATQGEAPTHSSP